MARRKTNRQVNVPIPRGSDMERFYEQEARENGVQLPTHFYQLLKDRFEALQGKGQERWFPRHWQQQQIIPTRNTSEQTSDFQEALAAFGGEDED